MKNIYLTLSILFIQLNAFCQWHPVDTVNAAYYGICFVNDSVGYMGGYGYYKKTTDGGLNWQVDTLPSPQGYVKQFNFFDNGVALIGGNYFDPSYISTDGGNTWGSDTINYPCAFVPNSYVGISAPMNPFGARTPTFKTWNAGINWTEQGWITPNPNGGNTGAIAVSCADSLHACITAGEGSVYLTSDGGLTWARQTPYDSTYNFTNVYMHDSLNIFVVGSYGPMSTNYNSVILRTSDGGLSWNAVYVTGTNVQKVAFANNLVGFAGGDYLVETMDGGNTWTMDTTIFDVVDFSFPDARTGFLLSWDTVYHKGSVDHFKLTTGISNPVVPVEFALSPNPTTGELLIKTEGNDPQTITIYDVNGRIILTQPFKPEIDVTRLSSGIYFVEVQSRGEVARKRFVKM
jgi:photosystem II stability/assembly factor-like uncharacterized protein